MGPVPYFLHMKKDLFHSEVEIKGQNSDDQT